MSSSLPSLHSLLRTPLPASSIEHSLHGNFASASENSLVTAGANVIRIFRLRPQAEEAKSNDGQPPKMRLECVLTWTFHAPIQSLGKVRLLHGVRDTLLLSFNDAKLSVVEYDPENHDLKTVSLHVFEDDEMRGGYVHNHFVPTVRVDPDSRCAAMLVYGRKIIILPFKRDMSGADAEEIAGLGGDEGKKASAPVLASYTLDLKAVITTHKVDNIIDFHFLHGYNQPTLMILYEPLKTCPGRIAVRKDTCRLDVLTLDVKERISAFIWSKEVLPFDCVGALPVPRPIGGTLIFATNSLFYLNQGIPPYAVSINSIGDSHLDNTVIKKLEGVNITLDCAQAEFLTPERAVISLKGGELYVLSLLLDGMRSVRGFHLDRAAASVLTTCLSVVDDRFLFLGSRLGNSLLLQFTEKDIGSVYGANAATDLEPPSKKKRMANDWNISSDVDLEVYGKERATGTSRITSYSFEVCDSLLNIGPCGNVTMGEPAFLSEEFAATKKADPDVEVVTTSGFGKNGALCVLQQSVRPHVITTFELPGCKDMWTVVGESTSKKEKGSHSFLILSRADSTMILQTGQEINELDQSGFYTQGPTIFTGNMGKNKFIVQVSPTAVRLLSGTECIQELALKMTSPICHATCADPYLLVLTKDGEIVMLTLEKGALSIMKMTLSSKSKLMHISAYEDISGMFTTEKPSKTDGSYNEYSSSSTAPTSSMEDEDALLYGATVSNDRRGGSKASGRRQPAWKKYLMPVDPTFWLLMLRENGSIEIYSLPDFGLKYVIEKFDHGYDVLTDSSSQTSDSESVDRPAVPAVTEVILAGLGANGRRPLLLARSEDHELLAYEVFQYYEGMEKNILKIRFKKIKHGLILRERRGKSQKDRLPAPRVSLRPFKDIAGYEGVFICGPYPHWLMLTARGELRTHPMDIDGPIPCFTAFHNVNCPKGFLHFNRKDELRICVLPSHLSYDAPWPVRKVPLRCTPHFITYHLESKTYAVVTSSAETTKEMWRFNGDDKELTVEERDERFPFPTKDTFHVQLFSPVSWEPIPGTKLDMADWERVTAMKHLFLSSEGLHTGQKGYIVCSTSYSYCEDVTPRGNLRIYDVIEVVPEPGQPLTKNKIKTIYDGEQKGPVTAIASVNGNLVATVGQKIYIFQFKDKDLFGVAFIDSQIYIHQLATIKNFILVGDVMKSVDLLQFQSDYRTLAVISRDTKMREVYGCEFVVDNTQLAFLMTDADRNLIYFMYSPLEKDSNGGQVLVKKGEVQLGQHVTSLFRIRAKITDPTTGGRVLTGWEKRQVTWFGTLDGAFGYVLPFSGKSLGRITNLVNSLVIHLQHAGGLHPKSGRHTRGRYRELTNYVKGIWDGDLVFRFTDLPVVERMEIAKKMGTSEGDIMDDLAEIDRMAAHF